MQEEDGQPNERKLLARWRRRRPSPVVRCVAGVLYLAGFLGWSWVVHGWAAAHGHASWNEDPRPLSIGIAALTYWPIAIGSWVLLYPGDHRAGPWADRW